MSDELIEPRLITPNPDRLGYIRYAFERGYTEEQVHALTSIDPWFLRQVREMVDLEKRLAGVLARERDARAASRAQARRPFRFDARPRLERRTRLSGPRRAARNWA